MSDENMSTMIDWEQSPEVFEANIDEMIKTARNGGKVIPLAIHLNYGIDFLCQVASVLNQVNCTSCSSYCCKKDLTGHGVELCDGDVKRLEDHGYEVHILTWPTPEGPVRAIPTPCPFLVKNKCSIYDIRPLTCVLYPWDPGGWDGTGQQLLTFQSSCPEARRIVKQIYLMGHKFRMMIKKEAI